MTKHDHLRNLLNLGFLVDEKANELVENLNEEDFFKLIDGLKKEKAFIIDRGIIRKILTEDVKILRAFKELETFTVQDFVRYLNEKYSFLQDILIKKIELCNVVSINKCNEGSVSVIGMVKEKEDCGKDFLISLEDPTGEMQTVVPKILGERINLDDVIAVAGRVKEKTLSADKIIFPDIALKPVIYSKEPISVAFSDKKAKSDYQVFMNSIRDNLKGKENAISTPCIFKIGGVVFLLISGADPLEALKKRHVKAGNSGFLIEPAPDIVFTDKDVNANYKGISIVSKDKVIGLKTREVNDI